MKIKTILVLLFTAGCSVAVNANAGLVQTYQFSQTLNNITFSGTFDGHPLPSSIASDTLVGGISNFTITSIDGSPATQHLHGLLSSIQQLQSTLFLPPSLTFLTSSQSTLSPSYLPTLLTYMKDSPLDIYGSHIIRPWFILGDERNHYAAWAPPLTPAGDSPTLYSGFVFYDIDPAHLSYLIDQMHGFHGFLIAGGGNVANFSSGNYDIDSGRYLTAVPIPSALLLFMSGLLGVGTFRKKKNQAQHLHDTMTTNA